jgi:hypothetical protein
MLASKAVPRISTRPPHGVAVERAGDLGDGSRVVDHDVAADGRGLAAGVDGLDEDGAGAVGEARSVDVAQGVVIDLAGVGRDIGLDAARTLVGDAIVGEAGVIGDGAVEADHAADELVEHGRAEADARRGGVDVQVGDGRLGDAIGVGDAQPHEVACRWGCRGRVPGRQRLPGGRAWRR